jgi:hypothetical protein
LLAVPSSHATSGDANTPSTRVKNPRVDSGCAGFSIRFTKRGGVYWLPSNTPSLASISPMRIQSPMRARTQQAALTPSGRRWLSRTRNSRLPPPMGFHSRSTTSDW